MNGNEVLVKVGRASDVPGICVSVRDGFRGRLAMIACSDERKTASGFALRHVFDVEGADVFIVLLSRLNDGKLGSPPSYPSVALLIPSATLYEREIKDMFGLIAEGTPDPRPLVLHEQWPEGTHPLRKEYALQTKQPRVGDRKYQFLEVEGEGVSEIPVGPVHAGIIEPGHFRFSILGETVVNLETRLYYTHRGVEKLAESLSLDQAVLLSERISGDEAVANSTAYCQSIEKIAGVEPPLRALQVRAVCAEMERVYNHVGTLAALSLDAGFAYGYARLALLKERMMRLNEEVAGSRLLFGVNRIGGVNVDFTNQSSRRVVEEMGAVRADFERVLNLLRSESSVMDRLSGTGRVQLESAVEMGLLGVAARGSGMDCDTRRDHPYGAYRTMMTNARQETRRQVTEHMIQLAKAGGDVLARFETRVEEVTSSTEMVKKILENLDGELELKTLIAEDKLEPFGNALGYAESHRGQTLHWVMTGEDGRSIFRYKVRTASFANWPAIELAVLNDIVADFPLINKSLDLSYAGNDL
ncbi:MAG TPA: NADH-quinone oxidoreductase subunit C [Nitrososphaerales archaeon]|nr:NADH-quinone oxidoreductase subunit C [Nitrososphaerales archaeon]